MKQRGRAGRGQRPLEGADKGRAFFARAWNVFSAADVCIYIGWLLDQLEPQV